MKNMIVSGILLSFLQFLGGALAAQTCNLPAPSNLHVPSVGTTSLTVAYNAVPGAVQYRIAITPAWSPTTTGAYLTAGTSYTISGLTPGTSYTITVAAGCAGGGWGISTATNATTTIIVNEIVTNGEFPPDPGAWPALPGTVVYVCIDKQPAGYSPDENAGASYLFLRHQSAAGEAIARARIWADHEGKLHLGSNLASFSPPPGMTLAFNPMPQSGMPVPSEQTQLRLNSYTIATIANVTTDNHQNNPQLMFTITFQALPGGLMSCAVVNAEMSPVPCLNGAVPGDRTALSAAATTVQAAPNPFVEQLVVTLAASPAILSLLDARGNTVLREYLDAPASTYTLRTGHLSAGMYLLLVESAAGRQTRRVVRADARR